MYMQAMDVTGVVGFAKDFGTCKTLDDSQTDDTFELLKSGRPAGTLYHICDMPKACT